MKIRAIDHRNFVIHYNDKKFSVRAEGFMLNAYFLDLFRYDIMKKYHEGKFYFINGIHGLDIKEIKDTDKC